jgi:hypothetical protein
LWMPIFWLCLSFPWLFEIPFASFYLKNAEVFGGE